jgi:anaerobic magnesium-protoporphyrin IX monomethyl ester cyclase
MKVLLVNPPWDNLITSDKSQTSINEEIGKYPPLGLMYVAAYALENTDHEVRIHDSMVEGAGYDGVRESVSAYRPDVVGIATVTPIFFDSLNTARIVKEVDSDIHVNLGGPHTTIYPQETLVHDCVDSVTVGEGEVAFTQLINSLAKGESPSKCRGLAYKEGAGIVDNGRAPWIADLDGLPFPARKLTPYREYKSLIGRGKVFTTMMTSRGCPYQCIFCEHSMGYRFRSRSPINVVDEIEECTDMGIRELFVFDDTFTVDKKRVLDICREIKERGLDITWDVRARVNTVDRELLAALKSAGCDRIQYGIESGSDEILKILKKGITVDMVKHVFKISREMGFTTFADFMVGNPGETREHIMESIELANAIKTDYAQFSILQPFPESEVYEMGIKDGLFGDFWREFTLNPRDNFQLKVWEKELSRDELVELKKLAYRKFYYRPSKMIQMLLKSRSLREIAPKVKTGFRMLGEVYT